MLDNEIGQRTIRYFAWACALVLMLQATTFADISLPRIFSDHMVLQQNSQVEIWGRAEADQEIEIHFNDQVVSAVADSEGEWTGTIETPEAGGPFQVEVKSKNDQTKVVLNDVMVGEVWICGGQNNMAMPLADALNAEAEIEKAKDFSKLRLFTVGHNSAIEPFTDFATADGWNVCNPDSIPQFSAAAYFFGRNLSETLEVPIGLILCSKSGTQCEAWTSRKALEGKPELEPLLKHWDENDDPTNQNRPGNLYNGMVAPLQGIKFKGFIWYQGESNNGRGRQYATSFPLLIENWRTALDHKDAPFLFVQLAPHRYTQRPTEDLAEIWDAQLKTFRNVHNTGMVITTDLGDQENLEPKNKQEVGRRLALWAFADVYAEELKALEVQAPGARSGPIFKAAERIEGTNQLKITFDFIAEGLSCKGADGLTDFTICGVDQKFVPAQAVIEDGAVIVSADEIDDPQAVRFGWSDSAQPNLFNSADLPAAPFRTDDFKLLSDEANF